MQQEQLKENLVLVGSTNYDYVESLRAFIKNKQFVWSSWDFRIREEWRETIRDRVKNHGKFPIFFYLSKKKGGSGTVEFVGVISDIRIGDASAKSPDPNFTNTGEEDYPTEDFKSYTWFKFTVVDPISPLDLHVFRDIDTEDPVVPSQLISSFAYAFLPADFEESKMQEQAVATTSISVERDLRKYLVMNLNSLEPGLRLYQDQERTGEEYPIESGRMRIDILAKDVASNFVVIELKAGVADLSTFGQISAYVGWVKQNLAKEEDVRGIIVANDFDEKIKFAIKSVSHIKLKRYMLEFQFEDSS
jgi:hypothetical protein